MRDRQGHDMTKARRPSVIGTEIFFSIRMYLFSSKITEVGMESACKVYLQMTKCNKRGTKTLLLNFYGLLEEGAFKTTEKQEKS